MKTWIELVEIWCVGAWKAANRLKIRYISALKTTLKRKALVPFSRQGAFVSQFSS
jgi:hypothetical protein